MNGANIGNYTIQEFYITKIHQVRHRIACSLFDDIFAV